MVEETSLSSLSDKERQIAFLVARGLSNSEIADRLDLSVYTIRNRVIIILRKLTLRNRVQIASLVGSLTDTDIGADHQS